jgi:hypothetical protein
MLVFTHSEWVAFIAGVRHGEFDPRQTQAKSAGQWKTGR